MGRGAPDGLGSLGKIRGREEALLTHLYFPNQIHRYNSGDFPLEKQFYE